jgi:hypothetical protein
MFRWLNDNMEPPPPALCNAHQEQRQFNQTGNRYCKRYPNMSLRIPLRHLAVVGPERGVSGDGGVRGLQTGLVGTNDRCAILIPK